MANLTIKFLGDDADVAPIFRKVADDLGDVGRAADDASDKIGKTGREVADDFDKVGDAADKAAPKGSGFFGNMMSAASGFLAADLIGNIAGQMKDVVAGGIGDAQASLVLMASTEQTITTMGNAAGRSAQEIGDMSSALSDASGMSLFGDDQIQQSSNLLLTFGEIKGATFDTATALTVDLAAALGGAPADQAMMLGKALNDPIKGISALGKAGLTFSEEQKAMIKAMQESGDMAGAQAIITAELTKQVGGQAEAQAKAAGGMVQVQARMGEMAETLGSALLPVLDSFAGVLNDYVAPALEQGIPIAIDMVKAAIEGLAPVFGFLQGLFGGAGEQSAMFSGVLDALGVTWGLLQEIITLAVELIEATIVPIFTTIMDFLSEHSEEIETILTAAWTIIKTVIDVTLGVIKGLIATVLAVVKGDWAGAWEAIQGIFSTVWNGIKTILSAALTIIKTELSLAWDAVKGTIASAWAGITGAISGAWDTIKTTVTTKLGELITLITGLPAKVASTGAAIVQSIWDGIKGKWSELVTWFTDKLAELTDMLPFSEPKNASSPLAQLGRAGKGIVAQIQSGIASADPLAVGAPSIGARQGGGRGAPLAAAASNGTTVRIVFEAGELKKLIKATIEETLETSGARAFSRVRTGN